MSNTRPMPVDEWAPLFLTFNGTGTKFTKEQVLVPGFALVFEHCKLCDCNRAFWPNGETPKDHMRRHRADLTAWLARRRKEAAQRSRDALKMSRKERAMAAAQEAAREVILHPEEYEDDE